MNYAVIKTGGKQYLVSVGDKLVIEKLERPMGEEFDFEEVLLIGNAATEDAKVGKPLIAGAKVKAKVLEQGRGKKKIVFRFKRKTRYKKKKGHRQPYTRVEIVKIST